MTFQSDENIKLKNKGRESVPVRVEQNINMCNEN